MMCRTIVGSAASATASRGPLNAIRWSETRIRSCSITSSTTRLTSTGSCSTASGEVARP